MGSKALIHSPLVGPSTWSLVAAQLRGSGHHVLVPTLADSETDERAHWERHAESAATAINAATSNDPWILVGHSGAGPILPAIGERLAGPPVAYIFVDAGIPVNRASRLDMMKSESGPWAENFEKRLARGGRYPTWSDADLESLIPDDSLRRQVLKEMRARALDFFTEPISVPENWSRTPCGYIQFSEAYDVPARHARKLGWPFVEFRAGHFHMLVEPARVADALVEMARELQTAPRTGTR